MTDLSHLRGDFPILQTEMNGRPLIYLDSAATTQMPRLHFWPAGQTTSSQDSVHIPAAIGPEPLMAQRPAGQSRSLVQQPCLRPHV